MANTLPEGQFKIIDGPSKFDLICSLFDGKFVQITCELPAHEPSNKPIIKEFDVLFTCVEMEDGSYNSWIGEVKIKTYFGTSEKRKFYFNSKNRTGHIVKRASN
jgi:hypothetical protein